MTFNPLGARGGAPQLPSGRYIVPQFEERTAYGAKRQDPYNKLFEDRIIFLGAPVDDTSADDIMAQLIVLESADPDRDIIMYINSPGGSFTALTAIYDTMQYIRPDIHNRLPRAGRLRGRGPARRWDERQAPRLAERPRADPSAGSGGWRLWSGLGYRDPSQRGAADANLAGGNHRPALQTAGGTGPQRHRAGQDPDC